MTVAIKPHRAYGVGIDTVGFFEDWVDNYVSADRWTPTVSDSSSAATLALALKTTGATNGVLSLTQDATDNDELYFNTTINSFLFAANKPMICEARIQYAELATDDNNVIFGFMSATGADQLQDNGAGPVASASMAVIYKVDGGTVWRTRSQIGAAVGQTDSISSTTAGGSSYQTLRIEVNPISSTVAEIIYFCDGVQLETSAGVKIKDRLTYTNAVPMNVLLGCKTGGATAEVLLCDYICAYKKR